MEPMIIVLKRNSLAYKAYRKSEIQERHRHRYEFNNAYKADFEAAGMNCTGINPDSDLVEVVEIPRLRWFLGVQFHRIQQHRRIPESAVYEFYGSCGTNA